jgi:hypothetical protein
MPENTPMPETQPAPSLYKKCFAGLGYILLIILAFIGLIGIGACINSIIDSKTVTSVWNFCVKNCMFLWCVFVIMYIIRFIDMWRKGFRYGEKPLEILSGFFFICAISPTCKIIIYANKIFFEKQELDICCIGITIIILWLAAMYFQFQSEIIKDVYTNKHNYAMHELFNDISGLLFILSIIFAIVLASDSFQTIKNGGKDIFILFCMILMVSLITTIVLFYKEYSKPYKYEGKLHEYTLGDKLEGGFLYFLGWWFWAITVFVFLRGIYCLLYCII